MAGLSVPAACPAATPQPRSRFRCLHPPRVRGQLLPAATGALVLTRPHVTPRRAYRAPLAPLQAQRRMSARHAPNSTAPWASKGPRAPLRMLRASDLGPGCARGRDLPRMLAGACTCHVHVRTGIKGVRKALPCACRRACLGGCSGSRHHTCAFSAAYPNGGSVGRARGCSYSPNRAHHGMPSGAALKHLSLMDVDIIMHLFIKYCCFGRQQPHVNTYEYFWS